MAIIPAQISPAEPFRIVSLLPAATEIVAALGLGSHLIGRSHECDEPPSVTALPALTQARFSSNASSLDIHQAVGAALNSPRLIGQSALYALDIAQLASLQPDLILTQAVCAVCAISADDVAAAVKQSGHAACVLALSPTTLAGVWNDILNVGAVCGRLAKAREVVARLQARVAAIDYRVRGYKKPRVAVIEWLDPPMAAGNWVPEVVRLAGGTDLFGKPTGLSHWIRWEDVAAADPDAVILTPCGFTLSRTCVEAATRAIRERLVTLRACREGMLYAVDGHHLFNRPGPRLVDSLEVLAEILHPGKFRFDSTQQFAKRLDFCTA